LIKTFPQLLDFTKVKRIHLKECSHLQYNKETAVVEIVKEISVKPENAAAVEEYERIFESYLDICNQALEKNRDKFPYKDIWKARWKKMGANNCLNCAVYDDMPKIIYKLQLTEDMKIKILEKTHIAPDDTWPFKVSYLKNVVENPQDYIDHPANLDWGWLTEIFG
jgi:hypothetical protein